MTLPSATYRLQFRNGMTFDSAATLVPYLKNLGISHLYASPIFAATEGSTHGYDVTDPNALDPALGGREGFERLSAALKREGLGLIIDIVPNHMAASLENRWWHEVLEWGEASPYARYFDIDWHERLTLPFLGGPFEDVLERGELKFAIDRQNGLLAFDYFGTLYPLLPATYAIFLPRLGNSLGSTIARLGQLAKVEEARDFHEEIRQLLSLQEAGAFEMALAALSENTALIRAVHESQPWRLTDWREASQHLTYRRFFEVTGLVGLKVEDEAVFDDAHRLTLELVRSGHVQGLRLDHIDGLADPAHYLQRLRQAVGDGIYIIVEKILGDGEDLPQTWPISGTTGYEFIDALTHIYLDRHGVEAIDAIYQEISEKTSAFAAGLRAAKKLMVDRNFAGEMSALTRLAIRIGRETDEAALSGNEPMRLAIAELLIAFPVYRTYGTSDAALDPQDRAVLDVAQRAAASRLGETGDASLSLICKIMKGEISHSAAPQFRTCFQQLSGPVMAKAMEDTLFYRYNRLISANEVGGAPERAPGGVAAFHALMLARNDQQPHGLSATSTHDTKRGEDARARLHTLSEAPDIWAAAVSRWNSMFADGLSGTAGGEAPGQNVTWMIYQALAGVWPVDFAADGNTVSALGDRFDAYIEKALREAKLRSDWVAVDQEYEAAVKAYAARLLSDGTFIEDFNRTVSPFIRAGFSNSMAQTLIKITAPGIPDIYQGAEGLDFSLVDPDNRRTIDFDALASSLQDGADSFATPPPAAMKQRIVQACLKLRQAERGIFDNGDYIPLDVTGSRAAHVVAFARQSGDRFAITVTQRLMLDHLQDNTLSAKPDFWGDTKIRLPRSMENQDLKEVFGGSKYCADVELEAATLLSDQPVALLIPSTQGSS